jgi:hypothetical protein
MVICIYRTEFPCNILVNVILTCHYHHRVPDSSVSIEIMLRTGRQGFDPRRRILPLPLTSSRLWGPPSPPQCVPGTFPGGKCGRGVLLTTHPLPVLRLIKRGSIPPLPQCAMWAWYGTPLSLPLLSLPNTWTKSYFQRIIYYKLS